MHIFAFILKAICLYEDDDYISPAAARARAAPSALKMPRYGISRHAQGAV